MAWEAAGGITILAVGYVLLFPAGAAMFAALTVSYHLEGDIEACFELDGTDPYADEVQQFVEYSGGAHGL